MKRTGPPRRRAELRRDTDAARSWERSSRVPVERREDARGTLAEALRVSFRARRPARSARCVRCNRQAHAWHHWLAQQHLRTYMRGVARREALEPVEVRRRLRALLRDERNLSGVCSSCHDELERHAARWLVLVPAAAHTFAAELGPEWAERLRVAYAPARRAGRRA